MPTDDCIAPHRHRVLDNMDLDLERTPPSLVLEQIRRTVADPATRDALLALARAQLRTMWRI